MSTRYIGGLVYNPPGGWSGYFDGSGDYLSIPDNAGFDFGSGNFTIETWVNFTSASREHIVVSQWPGASNRAWVIAADASANSILFAFTTNGTTQINVSATSVFNANAWYHIAVCRDSTNLRIFVNGSVVTTYNISTSTIYNSSASVLIGAFESGSIPLLGYVSNCRIVKGTALYTAAFTPPSGPLQAITNTSLLTCAYPTFRDGSTNNLTVTAVGNTVVNTLNPFPTSALPNPALGNAGNGIYTLSQYASLLGAGTWPAYDPYYKNVTLNLHGNAGAVLPFNTDASTNNFQVTQVGDTRPSNYTPFIENGYWSNYFDSTSKLSYGTSTNLALGNGDFTIEGWFFPTTTGSQQAIFDWRTAGNPPTNIPVIGKNSSNFITFESTAGTTILTSTNAVSTNTWSHLAIVRQSGTIKIFVNGVASGSVANTTNFGIETFNLAYPSGGSVLVGYWSNIRMVKGTAVYTGAFTPSTTPLTAISGTQLLTCQSNRFVDNSSNAFTVTVTGSPSVNPYQPFTAPTGTSAYGSGYFDGTGDWLTPPASQTALTLATSDFTIEMWAYPTTQVRGNPSLFASDPSIGLANAILVQFSGTTGQTALWVNNTNLTASSTTNYIKLNQWNHVAVVRSGGSTYALYINGVAVNNVATNSTSLTTSNWYIGYWTVADNAYTGYMSNFRIVKGTAVYTSAFTPPTTPLTAITNTSLLTVQTNAPSNNNTFLDSSTNNFTITRNGNTTQGTFTPYGSNWSNYFDGSGDYLSAGSSISLSSNFTVEGWVYRSSSSGNGTYLLGLGNDYYSTGATFFVDPSTGYLRIYTGQAHLLAGTSGSVLLNTWSHVAFVRNSNTLRAYLNGVQVDSASWSATISGTAYIGAELNGNPTATVYPGSAGYLSNLRVNTTAVYTAAFTPSTVPLPAITGTQLLTCQSNRFVDNSTNAYTITKTGDTSVQRFSPFSPTTAYSTSVIGGSGYFDGTDYVQVANNTALNLSGTSFTMEAWVYLTSSNYTNTQDIIAKRGSGSASYQLYLSNPSGYIAFYNGTTEYKSTTALTVNAWSHCACVSDGTTVKIYVNGVQVLSQAVTVTEQNQPITIGYGNVGSEYFFGYLTDTRIVKGSQVYTSAFTPPTAPLTAISGTSLLLSYTNAGILDNAMMNDLETVGNAQISTSVKKYGTGSMYFDGTGDYLFRPSSPLYDFGTGDFTLEMWVYRNGSQTAYAGLVGFSVDSGNGLILGFGNADNKLRVVWNNAQTILASTAMTNTTWTHVALVRSGATVTCYQDGTSVGTSNISTSAMPFTGAGMVIGRLVTNTDNYYFNGYIDDLRITKGVARYTTTFTPPTSQVQDQ